MSETTKLSLFRELQETMEQWQRLAPESPQLEKLKELKQDIEEDYFTLVTVGEFKNGKSTFLNALLEEELLPVNVTPTTAAIHVLYQGEASEMEVVKSNGEKELLPLTSQSLDQFTAQADFDPNSVNYIKVPHPSSMLDHRVVLVDTPGVNDLNAHRVAVTHQFIPRADGILFMIDINAPFRKTELEFLEDFLMRNGTEHIVFIANFMDQLDDEEDVEEVLEFANRRLAQISGRKEHHILPLSALEALEGSVNNDQQLYEQCGMVQVKESIINLIQNGTKQQQKINRYQHRFNFIKMGISREIDEEKAFTSQTVDQLKQEQQKLQALMEGAEGLNEQLADYIEERTAEIKFMILKSMDHFEQRLKRELMESIEYHTGDNIKLFVERDLSRKIKNELTKWVDGYSQPIFILFQKLEKEISDGLAETFQQESILHTTKSQMNFASVIDIESPDTKNTTLTSGALLGGASALALVLGANVLFPIVAFVGHPWLSNKLKEKEWQKVKPTILEATNDHVAHIFTDFRHHMNAYIEETTEKIQHGSSQEFQRMVSHYHSSVKQKVEQKLQSEQDQTHRIEALEKFQQKVMPKQAIQNV
ncbi:dynamin family protein [Lentibacillus sp. Marseille-P4043]|uniref:dynamin family protein n=1 Tax=Lentibacillus sp. Marseille-P4043 TaxID=2040293 RepID=UPI000D0B0B7D|nr:dynamin family protein [Lentibacillus sp. Marseille-P4043]